MPYPVDHDTRNRLSAVPIIASPLQTRGVGTRFLPETRKGAEGRSADKRDGSRSRGERKGDITYINRLRGEGDWKRGRN